MFLFVVPPDPVTNLMAVDVTISTISISWINGFNGRTPITGARIDYLPEGGVLTTRNLPGSNPTTITLMGLVPSTNHTITVSLMNIAGMSDPTSIVILTDPLSK